MQFFNPVAENFLYGKTNRGVVFICEKADILNKKRLKKSAFAKNPLSPALKTGSHLHRLHGGRLLLQ